MKVYYTTGNPMDYYCLSDGIWIDPWTEEPLFEEGQKECQEMLDNGRLKVCSEEEIWP